MLATEKVAIKDKEVVVWADRDLLVRLLVTQEKREASMKDFLRYYFIFGYPYWKCLQFCKIRLINMLGKENQSDHSNIS